MVMLIGEAWARAAVLEQGDIQDKFVLAMVVSGLRNASLVGIRSDLALNHWHVAVFSFFFRDS